MSERFFDRKVKEFHELRMGPMTMDAFINIFLDLLHYVQYIKEEKVNIQQLQECLPPSFWDRIEFNMPKTLDTMLHKVRLCYEHEQLRQENLNPNREKSKKFFDNRKPGSNPQPYRKQKSNDSLHGEFQKIRARTYEG